MAEPTVNEYLVYCIYEAIDVAVWGTTTPTLCPNNHPNRAIDPSRTRIIATVSTNLVDLNPISTSNFETGGVTVVVPSGSPGSVVTQDVSFPVDMMIWEVSMHCSPNNVGDTFSIIANPNNIIGTTTSGIGPGTTVIPVTTAVLQAVSLGLDVSITDGVNTNALGRVVLIDNTNFQITVAIPTTNTFASGANIELNQYIARNVTIVIPDNVIHIAAKGYKGQILQANKILRIYYTNANGAAKNAVFRFELVITSG